MSEQEVFSPELALVDPELRMRAIELLNAELAARAYWSAIAEMPAHPPEPRVPVTYRHPHRPARRNRSWAHARTLAIATGTYTAVSAAQFAFWALVVIAALILSISLTYLP